MDLRSQEPFWLLKEGLLHTYASLDTDIHTDVVVIGGGISGALTAWYLNLAGIPNVVVDKRHVGMGSTAASTALLQYEIDTPLRELIKKVGKKDAVKSYLLCRKAIYDLEEICMQIGESDFECKPSFQYASYKKDIVPLRKEYELRKEAGIDVAWLEKEEIKAKFGCEKDAGILSEDGASVNAYALTHAILASCAKKGSSIYGHTEIKGIEYGKKGITLTTGAGKKIKAKKIIIACGYESQKYISKKIETFQSTYAIVSEPFHEKKFWYKNALIWETANPYLYLRTIDDNRLLIGGMDDDFSDPKKRAKALYAKTKALNKAFNKLFPQIRFKTDFSWAGVFAGTKDGLPYVGSIPERPHTYFALGFGGNGITFSVLAAQMIAAAICGKPDEDARIFRFNR